MTVLDKKQYLHQIVEDLQEEDLDKILAYLDTLETSKKESPTDAKFEELLALTNEKYKKVWEALA